MIRSGTCETSTLGQFFQEQAQLRLGGALTPWGPGAARYSRPADTLLHSLAIDLAFLLCAAARVRRPSLRWQAAVGRRSPARGRSSLLILIRRLFSS
jgi:hypothetical protein